MTDRSTEDDAIRVLVVDDDGDARAMYGYYLEHVGMRVETAADGDEALRAAQSFEPDVIVMDLAMPAMPGDQAAAAVKSDPRTCEVKIIGLSAYGCLARTTARVAPFDAFYLKPLVPRDLALVVEGLVFREDRKLPALAASPENPSPDPAAH